MLTGVAGWPVAHSRSPAMHNAAFRALGLDGWLYVRLPLAPERFAEAVGALPSSGYRGVNVTIPHKQAALAVADSASDAAKQIGAANTLSFGDGIEADNTDAQGFLDALGEPVTGRRALILGCPARDASDEIALTILKQILNADRAKNIVFMKRSMRPGFAGIDNELLYDPKTIMFFGDAKDSLTKLVSAVKAA